MTVPNCGSEPRQVSGFRASRLSGMLPKSRIVSALLVGLGIALVAAGVLAPRLLPADTRLPLDVGQQTWTLTDPQARARLMDSPDGRVVDSPVSHQLHLTLEEPSDEESASVRLGSALLRDSFQDDSDRLITAAVWNWQMDRESGEAMESAQVSDQLASPTSEVPLNGVWLKFPGQAKKGETYQVFDETLRTAYPAHFAGEIEMQGREVYRYHQEIEPENVRQHYAHPFLETDLDGEKGYLFHSATRDFYVDQASGLVVKMDEEISDYYALPDGKKAEEVLEFSGSMDDAQVDRLLDAASQVDPAQVTRPVSLGLLVLGVVLVLGGLLGSFGVFTRRREGDG